ncbi:MAG: hypothetical protein WCO26_07720 [Deltaproteobacteria bacterium]
MKPFLGKGVDHLKCSRCNYPLEEQWKRCPRCGTRVGLVYKPPPLNQKQCHRCGNSYDARYAECPYCPRSPKPPEIKVRSSGELICPSCNSDRVTKLSLMQDRRPSDGGGCGCSGCLLTLIIAILAPGLVLAVFLFMGLTIGVILARYGTYIYIGIGVIIVIMIIQAIYRSGLFICERCGTKFKP